MPDLIFNIFRHIRDGGSGVAENPVPVLPGKPTWAIEFLVNPQSGTTFHIRHQRGTRNIWVHTRQNMDMICNPANAQQFASVIGDAPRHVFVQFFLPFGLDKTLSVLYSENVMVVNLRICICHIFFIFLIRLKNTKFYNILIIKYLFTINCKFYLRYAALFCFVAFKNIDGTHTDREPMTGFCGTSRGTAPGYRH